MEHALAALYHRVRTHMAALSVAEVLGWPDVLADSVRETRVRLSEAQDCITAIEAASRRLVNETASTYLQGRSNQ